MFDTHIPNHTMIDLHIKVFVFRQRLENDSVMQGIFCTFCNVKTSLFRNLYAIIFFKKKDMNYKFIDIARGEWLIF